MSLSFESFLHLAHHQHVYALSQLTTNTFVSSFNTLLHYVNVVMFVWCWQSTSAICAYHKLSLSWRFVLDATLSVTCNRMVVVSGERGLLWSPQSIKLTSTLYLKYFWTWRYAPITTILTLLSARLHPISAW